MNVSMVTVDKGDIGVPVSDGWGIRVVMEKYKCCIIDYSMLNALMILNPETQTKHLKCLSLV
jgi:hypothetical protein